MNTSPQQFKIPLDFSKFNFEKIFGVVEGVKTLTGLQLQMFKTSIIEKAIAKYSDKQLTYIGDREKGRDFLGIECGLFYECKIAEIMPKVYKRKRSKASTKKPISFVLKNFHPGSDVTKQVYPEQTFSYVIFVDAINNSIGICDWETCKKNYVIRSGAITVFLDHSDVQIICNNVIAEKKSEFKPMLYKLIDEWI